MTKLEKLLKLYKIELIDNKSFPIDHKWIVTLSLAFNIKEKEELELLLKDHNDLIKNLSYAHQILSFIHKRIILNKEFIKNITCFSHYTIKQSSIDEFQYYIKILQEYISTAQWMAETSPATLASIFPVLLIKQFDTVEHIAIPWNMSVKESLEIIGDIVREFDETIGRCTRTIDFEKTKWYLSSKDPEGIVNKILEIDKIRYKEADRGTDVHTDVFILDKFEQQLSIIREKIYKASNITDKLLNIFDYDTTFDNDDEKEEYCSKKSKKKEDKKTKQNPSSFVRENITKE